MKKSYYPMEPQIRFSANVTPSKRRRIEINDDVEIYYYPENKEQHAHHFEDYDFDIDDLTEDLVEEDADESFEELM